MVHDMYMDIDMEVILRTMTKKTTILFSPRLYRHIASEARRRRTSVGHLIRQAVARELLLPDRKSRMEAVESLAAMDLPVDEWNEMKKEISEGRAGRRA
jgi:hypothetical protein